MKEIAAKINSEVENAFKFAVESNFPKEENLTEFIYAR
jgi:TPP-dependent pyruvate/acetoin dehydrogenase alpha subunit